MAWQKRCLAAGIRTIPAKIAEREGFPGGCGRVQADLRRSVPARRISEHDQAVTVPGPRIPIAWVMIFVALAALDFTLLRATLNNPSPNCPLLTLGDADGDCPGDRPPHWSRASW